MEWVPDKPDLKAFLDSFVSPANADETKLRDALKSVPEDEWGTVCCRLEAALSDLTAKNTLKLDEVFVPNEQSLRKPDKRDIAVMKMSRVAEESRRRQQQRT